MSDESLPPAEHWVPYRISQIIDCVCGHFRVTRAQIFGQDRHKTIAMARQIAMRLARDEGYSLHELGRAFVRDHSTCLSACQAVARRVARDDHPAFAREWSACVLKWNQRLAQIEPLLAEAGPPVARVRVEDVRERVA